MTKVERRILANQYRILAALNKSEAKGYKEMAEALENGYELHYDDPNVYDDTLSTDECREVLDILSMHDEMRMSAEASGVDPKVVAFDGFDGNNEPKQMGYAAYYCGLEQGHFKQLAGKAFDFNSHMERMPKYRAMLREWRALREAMKKTGGHWVPFTKAELERILSAT
jgi:uncharacterized protein YfbU (UPF0304 family)